jgi:hypothetical protein
MALAGSDQTSAAPVKPWERGAHAGRLRLFGTVEASTNARVLSTYFRRRLAMRRHDRGADPVSEFIKTIEIKNREGQVVERKEVVTAKGLLHLAHRERLSKIRTRLVQSPSKDNGETAVVVVLVVTQRGAFTGLGDANPRNVNARIAPHFIRMAETRALARALRAALDIGVVAIEELEEEFSWSDRPTPAANGRPDASRDHEPSSGTHAAPTNGHERPSPRAQPTGGYDHRNGPGTDAQMSDAQKRLLYRLAFEQGHEGDGARAWLQAELGVDTLSKVSKRQASAFIDRFKSSNGQNGHAGAS